MSTFAQVTQVERRPALRTIKLFPSDFADTWKSKPKDPVVVGLRLLSDQEETVASAGAADEAVKLYEETDLRIDAYNKLLVRGAVALAVCDPNDTREQHPALPDPEDTLDQILTTAGIRRVFDEVERLQVESAHSFREADDDEVRLLSQVLAVDEPLDELDSARKRRARRYIAFLLDELNGADPNQDRSG